jgi:hypothetical protein
VERSGQSEGDRNHPIGDVATPLHHEHRLPLPSTSTLCDVCEVPILRGERYWRVKLDGASTARLLGIDAPELLPAWDGRGGWVGLDRRMWGVCLPAGRPITGVTARI